MHRPCVQRKSANPVIPSLLISITSTSIMMYFVIMRGITNASSSSSIRGTATIARMITTTNSTSSSTIETTTTRQSNIVTTGYVFYPKIFGHVHMAKTAGTNINGELASHFERICGHKGFSSDYIEFNKKLRAITNGTVGNDWYSQILVQDVYADSFPPGFSRGRVPAHVMDEIGYQDCDWISHEVEWDYWKRIPNFTSEVGIELHVPCRDPIDHLMSQCNFRTITFDCSSKNLTHEVYQCLVAMDRFDNRLMDIPSFELKCFNPIPGVRYINYMSQFLQPRRIHANYLSRETNLRRDKENECLWKNETILEQVKDILLSQDYYSFCHQCMNSENKLPL